MRRPPLPAGSSAGRLLAYCLASGAVVVGVTLIIGQVLHRLGTMPFFVLQFAAVAVLVYLAGRIVPSLLLRRPPPRRPGTPDPAVIAQHGERERADRHRSQDQHGRDDQDILG